MFTHSNKVLLSPLPNLSIDENVCILYEWTDSKIKSCYMPLFRVMILHRVLSIGYSYQIYSSQQVRELYPLDINWYWIFYQWKISVVISNMLYFLQHFNLNAIDWTWNLAWKKTIDKLKWNMSSFKKKILSIF